MHGPIDKIREYLDEEEETRDKLLEISHRVIRKSSRAMATLHRGWSETVTTLVNSSEIPQFGVRPIDHLQSDRAQEWDVGDL